MSMTKENSISFLDNMFEEPWKLNKSIPFRGPLFNWRVNFSIDGYNGVSYDFAVISSGKRLTIHRYLWHKLVFNELTREEFYLFISMSETLKNNKIVGFLRARLEVPKGILRQRLNKMETLLGEQVTTYSSYQGMHRIRYVIQLEKRKLKKTTKFSGYIRNNSRNKGGRIGGTSTEVPVILEQSLILEELNSRGLDWYQVLTVGEFTLLDQKVKLLPDETH